MKITQFLKNRFLKNLTMKTQFLQNRLFVEFLVIIYIYIYNLVRGIAPFVTTLIYPRQGSGRNRAVWGMAQCLTPLRVGAVWGMAAMKPHCQGGEGGPGTHGLLGPWWAKGWALT